MFFMLAVGYLSRRFKLVTVEQFKACTSVIFQICMPIHIFISISKASIREVFDPKLMAFSAATMFLSWLAGMLIVPRIELENRKRGAMIQGFFRSNVLIFGMTIIQTLCPEASGALAIVGSVTVPLANILSVVCLEAFRGGKPNVKSILIGIAKNNLVQGAALGVLYLLSGWTMPAPLFDAMSTVAATATPMALVALGGTFFFSTLRSNFKQLVIVNLTKLFFVPAIALPLAVLCGLKGPGFAVLVSLCCTPIATTAFPMTQQMGGDGELAGQIVVSTVFFSVFSTFLWVLLLSNLGLC